MAKNPKRPPLPKPMPHFPKPQYQNQIADIFSKSKTAIQTCPNPEQEIIIDTREKNSMILAKLRNKNANHKLKTLQIGDYIIGNITIERKTINDLINAMKSKRLTEQLKNLKQCEKPLLILENYYGNKHSQIHPNAINGLLLSITLHHNIPILYTENEEHTSQLLIQIAQKNKHTQPSNPKKIPKTLKEQQYHVLESFPGIGPKTVQELLKEFHSIKKVINANKEELEPILKKHTKTFMQIISPKENQQ